MTQYISKSALVAEINQRIEDYKSYKIDDSYHDGLIFALEDLRDDFIDTLEVKEMNSNDAFIEKACDWLSDNLQTIVDVDHPSRHHVESIPVLGSITQTEFLEKFSKEIKYLFD